MSPTPTAPARTSAPLLEVENLRTELTTARGPLTAVAGVSLRLRAGETLGIVGESGSGKSVLGRSIMGLHRDGPGSRVRGQVRLEGREVHAMATKQLRSLWGSQISMVFQDPGGALNPVMKVGTHLADALRKHQDLDRRAARARAEELLRLVGIPEPRRRLRQYPHELSGGMAQRVVIAIALCNDPRLLIADEPTTALDVTVQKQILDLLARLQTELGMGTLLISHNLQVVASRTDRIAVMYAGRIVEEGPSMALFARPQHPYTAALLSAVPRLRQPPHQRLATIPGAPPDMTALPTGCPFAPRCPSAQEDCRVVDPPLEPAGGAGERRVACLHPLGPSTRSR